VTHPVFRESRLGMIFTNGDPSGKSTNTVAGVDFQYLNSNLLPGKVGEADLFYARSASSTKGDDDTYGVTLNFPNEPYGGNFHFKQIGPDYFPALGFINRTNIRQYDNVLLRRERRWQGFRFMDLSTSWFVVTDLQNAIQSRENMIEGAVTTPSPMSFTFVSSTISKMCRCRFSSPTRCRCRKAAMAGATPIYTSALRTDGRGRCAARSCAAASTMAAR
jgi:hypothetical protein